MTEIAALAERLRAGGSVFAEDEAAVLIATFGPSGPSLEGAVRRRLAGEPLEPIVGWVGFAGLRIEIDAGVFVPRQRTAFLAEQAIARVRPDEVLVDLCCGAGAVGAAVVAAEPTVDLHAVDVDPVAAACARRNLAPNRSVYCGDLFAPLPIGLRGRVGMVLANAPYVPTAAIATMPSEARDFEPRIALDGGPDGLDVHRRICAEVGAWLAPGGRLLIETSAEQSATTRSLARAAGLTAEISRDEERDATVVIARRATIHIVVMGVTGSGKSTIGRALAERIGRPFADADDFHAPAAVAQMAAGHPLSDADRQPWLDRVGRWLGAQPDGAVVACSALKRSYRDRLREACPDAFFVHLDCPPDVATARVAARQGHFMPAGLVGSQFADLEPLDTGEAGLTADCGVSVEEVIGRLS
jgi:release factor glutamine methyltransferase